MVLPQREQFTKENEGNKGGKVTEMGSVSVQVPNSPAGEPAWTSPRVLTSSSSVSFCEIRLPNLGLLEGTNARRCDSHEWVAVAIPGAGFRWEFRLQAVPGHHEPGTRRLQNPNPQNRPRPPDRMKPVIWGNRRSEADLLTDLFFDPSSGPWTSSPSRRPSPAWVI